MARRFIRANSECLYVNEAVVATPPFTMACWGYMLDDTTNTLILAVCDRGVSNHYHTLGFTGTLGGKPLRVASRGGGTASYAASTSGFSANTWHHACGVWSSTTSRKVYLDGGSSAEKTDSITPSGLDRSSIGALARVIPAGYMDGNIAEAGFWNVALTVDEIAALAKGYSPVLVRPESLVSYRDLIYDLDQDYIGDRTWSAQGSPWWVNDHPGIIYPTRPQHGMKKPAPSVKPWWYYQRAAMRRAN